MKRNVHPKLMRWLHEQWWKILLLAALCALLGVLDAVRSYISAYHDGIAHLKFNNALRWDLTGWLAWLFFIPLVIWLCRRFPLTKTNWLSHLLRIFIPVGLLIVLARTLFPAFVHKLLFDGNIPPYWLFSYFDFLFTDFVIAIVFYALVLAFGQAINYYKNYREAELRASRLEAQMTKAQLQALKMQLHPHFLFNTLNSISALQMEDVEAAQEMTARLGDFLRMTLQSVGTQEVTLEREIEFLQCYLDIEKVRFGTRLATSIEIEPEVRDCQVPNLILQPLVENAIRHGLSKRMARGRIDIRAGRENGWLKVEVADNGKGIKGDFDEVMSVGLGLSNTRARLEQLYGDNFRFNLRNCEAGGLVVELRLPRQQEL